LSSFEVFLNSLVDLGLNIFLVVVDEGGGDLFTCFLVVAPVVTLLIL
jgi:hypothetical protein